MEEKDNILSALLANVGKYQEPEDHPTLSSEVAAAIKLPLKQVLSLCRELTDEGMIVISPLNEPPLLYLTITGLIRARRNRLSQKSA